MEPLVTPRTFRTPLDRAAVESAWRDRGYSCDEFVDPPGREWNDFVHDVGELVTVIEGRLRLTIAGREWGLDPGDEAFIPRGAVHSVKNIHPGITRWLYGYERSRRA